MQNRHAQVDLEKEISIVNRFQGDGDLENRDAFVHRLIKEKLLIFLLNSIRAVAMVVVVENELTTQDDPKTASLKGMNETPFSCCMFSAASVFPKHRNT